MSSKLTQLKEYSNPEFVSWKAQQMGLTPVYESSRKVKKYMVFDGNKMIYILDNLNLHMKIILNMVMRKEEITLENVI
jgi:hypothetical protein